MLTAMYITGILALLMASFSGYCAVRRSERWNHPGHRFGVAAVLWLAGLAWLATPSQDTTTEIQRVELPAITEQDALAWKLVVANWQQRKERYEPSN